MIQKTRRQLIFIYWTLSSLLLTLALGASAYLNYSRAVQSEHYFFENKIQTIIQEAAYEKEISPSFFHNMKKDFGISIYSTAEKKLYGKFSSKGEEQRLKKASTAFLSDAGLQNASLMGMLPFRLGFTRTDITYIRPYYAVRFQVETLYQEEKSFLAFYDVSGKLISSRELTVYLALESGGLFLLFLICRFFVKTATKPIIQNIRKQNEFVASASHELKTPVSVIQLNAEALQNADPDTGRHLLCIIIRECRHLTALIQNMLLLASSDSCHLRVQCKDVEIDHFFISIYEHYMPYCRQHNHTLQLNMDDSLPAAVQADPILLKQVVSILIDNAVSYSVPDTPISLTVKNEHGFLKVSLTNHSEPVSVSEKEKLFERFYRVASAKPSYSHAGLGLSIAREIVTAHKGKIYLENRESSVFRITFSIPLRIS